MAAALKQFFALSAISRQFSSNLLRRYIGNHFGHIGGRLFSIITLQKNVFLLQNHCINASIFGTQSKFFHVGSPRSGGLESNERINDPEFKTEQVFLPGKHVKGFGNVIKSIKEKTGVIMKVVEDSQNDDEVRWQILIGDTRSFHSEESPVVPSHKMNIEGTQHEVQQATFYLKSLIDQDEPSQRLILLQDDKIDPQQHSTKRGVEKPIWVYYRRNFKGQKPPMKTRKKCIRGKGDSQIVSGNPCAICRLYLAGGYKLDHKDVDLLSQFISPHTGDVFEASKTGVCRYQQENLVKAIQRAKDYGLLRYSVPGPRSIAKPAQRAEIPVNVRLK